MTEIEECVHGIYPETACTICNGRKTKRAEISEDWRTFPAKYEGTCAGCGLPIAIGQFIVWRPDSPTYHDGCEPQ